MLTAEHVARKSSHTASPLRASRSESHATGAPPVGMGNQAMQRLLRTKAIQTKLTVNEPGDRFEQEADRTADAVMRMPDPRSQAVTPVLSHGHPVQVQRMCAACAEEEKVQRKCAKCDEEEIHRTSAEPFGRTPDVTRDVQDRIDAMRSGGEALPLSVRDDLEPRFGYDFSQVRIHTGAQANESARSVNALAFTLGNHIVFDAGKFEPATAAGRHLLAHELTHVIQQSGNPTAAGPVSQSAPTQIARQDAGEEACWRTEDIIDSRIDTHAQSALMEMFSDGGQKAADASAILSAVKDRQLEGVYLPDQRVPALRARVAGSNWWEMIPSGKPATCFKQPDDRVPLITFRKTIKDDRNQVAEALSSAWAECEIPAAPPRCYIATIQKPIPKKEDPVPENECETDQDCIDKGIGDFCTPEKRCARRSQPTPSCECDPSLKSVPGQDPSLACRFSTGNLDSECVHKPGAPENCGICTRPGSKELDDCLKEHEKQRKQDEKVCDGVFQKESAECLKKMAECALKRDAKTCAKAADCITGRPSRELEKCRKEAFQRRQEALKKCKENSAPKN